MIDSHFKLENVELGKESVENSTDSNLLWNKESTSPRINFKEAQGCLKLLLRKFKKNLLHFSLYNKTQHEISILGIIERDENPSRSVRLIQIGYDRSAKYLITHLILLFLGIMALITSAMQADHNTSIQTNKISAYAIQRWIRYRIKYRHNLWLRNTKQSERRPRKMVGPWKKFRRPDGIFWPPECRDLSIKILIATADLDRRLNRKRRKELSGGE